MIFLTPTCYLSDPRLHHFTPLRAGKICSGYLFGPLAPGSEGAAHEGGGGAFLLVAGTSRRRRRRRGRDRSRTSGFARLLFSIRGKGIPCL